MPRAITQCGRGRPATTGATSGGGSDPASLSAFYEAAASVACALIGLLFVAITVAQECTRDIRRDAPQNDASEQVHQIRAAAALASFTSALAVSLFTLIEGQTNGTPATVVAISGLLFVLGSLISIGRAKVASRGTGFLATLLIAFAAQLIGSLRVASHPNSLDDQRDMAALVVVFFLIGIARSWDLIGGPRVGLGQQLRQVAVHRPKARS
jgi:hypothetical protein